MTLHELALQIAVLEARFEMQNKHHAEALALARKTIDERLSHMNQFREEILEDRGQYVTKNQLLWALLGILSFVVAVATYIRGH